LEPETISYFYAPPVQNLLKTYIEQIYALLDLFVLPSIREPFGLVLLEAMASGIPVVATGSGGPNEFIQSGENGILVPSRDAKMIAQSVKLLLQNKEKAKAIARLGRKTVEKGFGITKTVEATHQLYLSLIEAER